MLDIGLMIAQHRLDTDYWRAEWISRQAARRPCTPRVAIFPMDAMTADSLLHVADTRMYAGKRVRRDM